jgi:hypothetical protein
MKLRRIRSGKGFLPTKPKDPEWTGIMLRRRIVAGRPELDERGQVVIRARPRAEVEPLMKPDQVRQAPELVPAYCEAVAQAMREELEQAAAELAHPERGERLLVRSEEQEARQGMAKVIQLFGRPRPGAELSLSPLSRVVSRETMLAPSNGRKGHNDRTRQSRGAAISRPFPGEVGSASDVQAESRAISEGRGGNVKRMVRGGDRKGRKESTVQEKLSRRKSGTRRS